MTQPEDPRSADDSARDVQRIAELAAANGCWVAAAESLTSGGVALRLGAGPSAAEWFRGGVVAYHERTKFELLGVTPGPVVTARCATELALGACRVLDAGAAVGITGVGGPEPDEGRPAGTVFVAVTVRGETEVHELHLDGDPAEVIDAAAREAVGLLARRMERALA